MVCFRKTFVRRRSCRRWSTRWVVHHLFPSVRVCSLGARAINSKGINIRCNTCMEMIHPMVSLGSLDNGRELSRLRPSCIWNYTTERPPSFRCVVDGTLEEGSTWVCLCSCDEIRGRSSSAGPQICGSAQEQAEAKHRNFAGRCGTLATKESV